MDTLQVGDWVRTENGAVGKVVLLVRLSAFVEIADDKGAGVTSYLLSQLMKIDPPDQPERLSHRD